MASLLFIAIGGSIGTLLRAGLSILMNPTPLNVIPWGTLFINCVGCFFLGFFWGITDEKPVSIPLQRGITTGILGAFTTFSALCYESVLLYQSGKWGLSIAYLVLSNFLGILFIFLGLFFGKILLLKFIKI